MPARLNPTKARRGALQPPCAGFGHFSPGVPDSLHVAAYPRVSAVGGRGAWRPAIASHPGGRALWGRVQPAPLISPTSHQKWVTPRKSPRIPAYSRQSQSEPVLANPLLISRFSRVSGNAAFVDRTQEVGGSNPPSSIGRTPCTSAGSLFQDRSNRPSECAPFRARVAEIAWMRGD